jgi:hypothetical protein
VGGGGTIRNSEIQSKKKGIRKKGAQDDREKKWEEQGEREKNKKNGETRRK